MSLASQPVLACNPGEGLWWRAPGPRSFILLLWGVKVTGPSYEQRDILAGQRRIEAAQEHTLVWVTRPCVAYDFHDFQELDDLQGELWSPSPGFPVKAPSVQRVEGWGQGVPGSEEYGVGG